MTTRVVVTSHGVIIQGIEHHTLADGFVQDIEMVPRQLSHGETMEFTIWDTKSITIREVKP